LAATIPLECQMAFAEPDAEQGSTVISIEQNETLAATDTGTQAAEAKPAASGVPNSSTQGDTANAGKAALQPPKKGTQASPSIPSTNPDDANKHPAWRKREANKIIVDLPKIKKSMMEQGAQ
jgi:hypothetical protein